MNDHFHSDVSVKSIGDYLKLQSSVKNVFKNGDAENKNEEERLRARRRIRYAQRRS